LLRGPNICDAVKIFPRKTAIYVFAKAFGFPYFVLCAQQNLKYTTFITMGSVIEMVGTSSDNEPVRSSNVKVRLK